MSSFQLRGEPDAKRFEAAVRPFLEREEAKHCLSLGMLGMLARHPDRFPPPHFLAMIEAASKIEGAIWMTSTSPLCLSEMPLGAMDAVIAAVVAYGQPVRGVRAPRAVAAAFVSAWILATKARVSSVMGQRIFQADRVIATRPVPGSMRFAEPRDLDLLSEWKLRFAVDCGLAADAAGSRQNATLAIEDRRNVFWVEPASNRPVAMASFSGETPRGMRINGVYTPPELRGRGYASAAVAGLTQYLLDAGRKFCFLYTDLANPTSNRIYQAIGYHPVCDSSHFSFSNS